MLVLNYLDKFLKIENSLEVNNSSRETNFSSVVVDFSGYTESDLPVQYQEVTILDVSGSQLNQREVVEMSNVKRLFTGYLESYDLPILINNWSDVSLQLNLLSPYAMTSTRTVSLKGTYRLNEAIGKILQPLIEDGYTLKILNVVNTNVYINFSLETIENIMNNLSNNYNFWWFIDFDKNIYVEDLTEKFYNNVKETISNDNIPAGLYGIKPSMDAIDYCNVINLKKVRMYIPSAIWRYRDFQTNYTIITNPMIELIDYSLNTPKTITLKKGDQIDFVVPFDITLKNIEKCIEKSEAADLELEYPFLFEVGTSVSGGGVNYYIQSSISYENGQLVFNDVGFQGTNYDNIPTITLIRDSFFSNLITGFVYNGDETITGEIISLISISALAWVNYRVADLAKIENAMNKVSKTGIVEKIVDMNEAWLFEDEALEIANSHLKRSGAQNKKIILTFDINPNLNIGDTINLDLGNFFSRGTFVVTDSTFCFENDNSKNWSITLNDKNVLENFIDLFRSSDLETDSNKVITDIINYNFSENFKEIKEVS